MKTTRAKKEWWKTFFDANYIREWEQAGIFRHTRREISFLIKEIPIRKRDVILDLCCGHGRHAFELARRGYAVTGLDYSAYELGLARKEAQKQELAIRFVKGDARNFRFREKFNVILNLFTAFGYGTRRDDENIIRSASRALKRGGRFFIDIQSLPWLWKNFRPRKTEKVGSRRIVNTRTYDFSEGMIFQRRTVFENGRKRVYHLQNRTYTLRELKDMFAKSGLKITKFFGSYKGESFGWGHKRMLVVAKKR